MKGRSLNATGLLVSALPLVAVAALIIVAVYWLTRPKERPPAVPATAEPSRSTEESWSGDDPRTLRPGDLVDIRDVSYAVRGSLRLTEQSWCWSRHLLDAGPAIVGAVPARRQVWLSVGQDLELVLWREVTEATTTAPDADTVDFGGRRYRKGESGTARFAATGATGLHPSGIVRYVDYATGDGARLSFESFSGPGGPAEADRWVVGRGEPLLRSEFRVISPGTPD